MQAVLLCVLAACLCVGCVEHAAHHPHEKERESSPHHHKPSLLLNDTQPPLQPREQPQPGVDSAPSQLNASVVAATSSSADFVPAPIVNATGAAESTALSDFLEAFLGCFFVILATEIGDKTFFIAAILTMRHSRLSVWAGAMAALSIMTVLSAVVGHAAPLFLDPVITHYMAIALFIFFGIKMLRESRSASGGVEQELTLSKTAECEGEPLTEADNSTAPHSVETTSELQPSTSPLEPNGFCAVSPIVLQAFTLTFVAEWGDRSQISTIAMGADQDVVGVTLG
ncbi:MAG: hypothetical protein SGPRY_012270, partial [Prymnesium sp.]